MSTNQRFSNACTPLSKHPIPNAKRGSTSDKYRHPVTCVGSLTTPGFYRKSKNDDWKPINQPAVDDEDFDRSNVTLKKDKKKVLTLNLSDDSEGSSSSEDETSSVNEDSRSEGSEKDFEGSFSGEVSEADTEEPVTGNSSERLNGISQSSISGSSDDGIKALPSRRECASEDEVDDIWAITDDVLKMVNYYDAKNSDVLKISDDSVAVQEKTEKELQSEKEDLLLFGRIKERKPATRPTKRESREKLSRAQKKSNNRGNLPNYTSKRGTSRKTQQKIQQNKQYGCINQKGEVSDGKSSGSCARFPAYNTTGNQSPTPPPGPHLHSLNENNNKPTTYADVCKKLSSKSHRVTGPISGASQATESEVSHYKETKGSPDQSSSSSIIVEKVTQLDINETKTKSQQKSEMGLFNDPCETENVRPSTDTKDKEGDDTTAPPKVSPAGQPNIQLDDPAIVCVSSSPPCAPLSYNSFATSPAGIPSSIVQNNPYTNYIYSCLNQLSPQDLLMIIYELKIMEAMNMNVGHNVTQYPPQ